MADERDYEQLMKNVRVWVEALKARTQTLDMLRELDYDIKHMDAIIANGYEILGEDIEAKDMLDISVLYKPGEKCRTSDEVRVEYLKNEDVIEIINVMTMALAKLAVVALDGKEGLEDKWIPERIATELEMQVFKLALDTIPTGGEDFEIKEIDEEDDEEDE